LRYVFVGDTLVNALVVRKGFLAVDLPEGPVVHGDTLLVLERTAARVGKGLWPFNVYTPPSFAVPEEFLADTSGSDPWLETVSYDRAEEYYGRIIRVVGTVVATYRSDKVFIMERPGADRSPPVGSSCRAPDPTIQDSRCDTFGHRGAGCRSRSWSRSCCCWLRRQPPGWSWGADVRSRGKWCQWIP
jgi:hypothetical protein